ncbi:MAG: hypothetical protein KDK08_27485 [Rhizobiaceae bacterium]|nr:hypothetical protein [Rhizobiaceae bacterium]
MTRSKRTDALMDEINRRRNAGATWDEIAQAIGIAESTIRDWCGYRQYKPKQFRGRVELLPAVPEDSRTLDQRLTGCPLPGRSALDKKNAKPKSIWS